VTFWFEDGSNVNGVDFLEILKLGLL